jgi:hypothetical protein
MRVFATKISATTLLGPRQIMSDLIPTTMMKIDSLGRDGVLLSTLEAMPGSWW